MNPLWAGLALRLAAACAPRYINVGMPKCGSCRHCTPAARLSRPSASATPSDTCHQAVPIEDR